MLSSSKKGNIGFNFVIFLVIALVFLVIGIYVNLYLNLGDLQIALVIAILVLIYLLLVVLRFGMRRTGNVVRSISERALKEEVMKGPTGSEEALISVKPQRRKFEASNDKYIGSTQTMKYHTIDCRLAKRIAAKYRLSDSSPAFFKKRKFKPCKICIK